MTDVSFKKGSYIIVNEDADNTESLRIRKKIIFAFKNLVIKVETKK